jgi:NADH-quinone oxidoreductase subunit G
MDAVGSNIRVDSRGREVMRILPRVNDAVNEEWISDKTRHVWDGLKTQRLDRPYVRKNGKLQPASWDEAFAAIAKAIKASGMGNKVGAIAGDLAAVEDMYALKTLMTALGSGMTDVRPPMSGIDPGLPRSAYIFNPTIAGIDEADAILIVGSNPRKEAAVLNARIRKAWRTRGVPVAVIGDHADLTYKYDWLGDDISALAKVAAGEGFGEKLKAAKKPLVIVGEGAVSHGAAWNKQIGRDVISLAAKAASLGEIAEGWNGFALLHNAASRVGGLDIGFVPHNGGVCSADQVKAAGEGKLDVLFLLGADEYDTKAMGKTFVVYVGTHGDAGAHRADVILPAAAYTEKPGTYVNTEGRVQLGARAGFPLGDAKEDWAILRALSDVLGHRLPFDSLPQLRAKLYADVPHMARIETVTPADPAGLSALGGASGSPDKAPFRRAVTDLYLTNPIARASAVMAECSALARELRLEAAE